MATPLLNMFIIFPVHGLVGLESGISSFSIEKTPRIEGENLK